MRGTSSDSGCQTPACSDRWSGAWRRGAGHDNRPPCAQQHNSMEVARVHMHDSSLTKTVYAEFAKWANGQSICQAECYQYIEQNATNTTKVEQNAIDLSSRMLFVGWANYYQWGKQTAIDEVNNCYWRVKQLLLYGQSKSMQGKLPMVRGWLLIGCDTNGKSWLSINLQTNGKSQRLIDLQNEWQKSLIDWVAKWRAKAIDRSICKTNGKSHWLIDLWNKWQKPSVDWFVKQTAKASSWLSCKTNGESQWLIGCNTNGKSQWSINCNTNGKSQQSIDCFWEWAKSQQSINGMTKG